MAHMEFRAPRAETLEELVQFLEAELFTIYQALNDAQVLDLRIIHAEPERPRDGMLVFADGTNWDPGNGRGLYTYDSGWKKLGPTWG